MIGKEILHYKILDELGKGGMGVVYKAQDTKLKYTVKLNLLPVQILSERSVNDYDLLKKILLIN